MLSCFTMEKKGILLHLVTKKNFASWLTSQSSLTKNWLMHTNFQCEAGQMQFIPNEQDGVTQAIFCINESENDWDSGSLPFLLPEGVYQLNGAPDQYYSHALAWGLGAYQFSRYKKPQRQPAQLFLSSDISTRVNSLVEAIYLIRDCINTPSEDMGPSEFALLTEKIAKEFGADFSQIIGDDLLTQNYAAIHTVGRAGDDAPRLIDLRWGDNQHPKVTLVGKGVCFDSGGLDIKPSNYMLLMKKDMAGAAHVLGLARLIMQARLPICLRVLIPLVENVISGNAYKPGDVIKSRKGLTIEIGNTDAEGRVVLSDALVEAVSEKPDLLIDIATLTGAARVALGTDLPAVFSNRDELVQDVMKQGVKQHDLMWHMPLFAPYRESLNSQIADINNCSIDPYAGAITAALFLKEFVPDSIPWLHFDLMAWNLRPRPGRPQGGEAMVVRALFAYLQERYK